MAEPEVPDAAPGVEVLEALDVFREGAGSWLVETASRSRYVVTTDGNGGATLVRTPDLTFNATMGEEWRSVALRRDGAMLRVLSAGRLSISDVGETSLVPEIAVGFPAVWVVEPLAEDATFTTRRTTTVVVSITPLAERARGEC